MTVIIKSNQKSSANLGNIFGIKDPNYSLLLDFSLQKYIKKVGGVASEISFSDAINFTRTSKATYLDNRNTIRVAEVNEPRFHYDPTTQRSGLLLESARTERATNVYAPATQTVTITGHATIARSLTLIVKGMGSATLSGTNVTLDPGSPALSEENKPAVYSIIGTQSVTVSVTGNLEAISLLLDDGTGGSARQTINLFTPPDLTTVATDNCQLSSSLLSEVLAGKSEYTIVIRATESPRAKSSAFRGIANYLEIADLSETNKGIYIDRHYGAYVFAGFYVGNSSGLPLNEQHPCAEEHRSNTFAISYNANTSKFGFSINGEVREKTLPFPIVPDQVKFGSKHRRGSGASLNGILHSVVVYPFAMTPEQLMNLPTH